MPAWGLIPDSAAFYWGKKLARGARGARRGPSRTRSAPLVREVIRTKVKYSWRMSKITIYDEALHRFLNTPTTIEGRPAPLWNALHAKGEYAVARAKAKVGVKTGALRKSIHMRHLGNRTGQYLWIGSEKPYAYMHHQGTKPHPIVATNPGGVLIFTKGTRLIRTPMVNHPGTRPNWYLRAQLRHFKTLV
jgi:hypothetical protein